MFFYHPDHLGTSTSLTDFNGNAYQFFLNLPFGETMAEQLGSNYYNSPYKFNGKELDEETGLYHYGARYYDPRISIWQSVDALSEKYPNWNPYNYCKQSPISRYDPDGNDDIFTASGRFVKHVDNGTDNIMIQQGKGLIRIDNFNGSSNWFSSKDDNNRAMMTNVVKYYLGKVSNNTKNSEATNDGPNDALAFYNKSGDKGVKVKLASGFFPEFLSNSENLINTLLHETFHKIDDEKGVESTYFSHASVYVKQMASKTFSNCSEDFQTGMIDNFRSYLSGIKDEKQQQGLLDKFNKTNSAGYTMDSFYLYKDGKRYSFSLKPTPETPN